MSEQPDTEGEPEGDYANSLPTKRFFVDMLVRDIALTDAILDLLDNCVDGILRTCPNLADVACPYVGYRADLVVSADRFSITDNCGGIPIAIARDSAFAMGRPKFVPGHAGSATVGMYGVGMKRAIFKFGRHSVVTSNNDAPLRVEITPEWLDSESWDKLPITHPPVAQAPQGRTEIVVDELHSPIREDFDKPEFRSELGVEIARHFALIIAKGFAITIRAGDGDAVPAPIAPAPFALLGPRDRNNPSGVVPWIYRGRVGAVSVDLYAGLYRPFLSDEELDEEEVARGSATESGWVVACNDRVVIWKDRTRMTGWGESSVPNWHGQFLGITGIVMLRADNPDDLPLTTTKRGVDAGSEVWSLVKDMMREATKAFTAFTYKWKAMSPERRNLFVDREPIPLAGLRAWSPPTKPWHKLPDDVRRFAPTLPAPVVVRAEARVSFRAPKNEVRQLAIYYFDEEDTKPADVGLEAFRRELASLPQAAE